MREHPEVAEGRPGGSGKFAKKAGKEGFGGWGSERVPVRFRNEERGDDASDDLSDGKDKQCQ